MKKAVFCLIVAAVLLPAVVHAQEHHPVNVVVSPWIGYGPLYIAEEKGFFDDVDVEISIIADTDTRIARLMGRYAQIVAAPAGAMVRKSRKELDFRAFMVIDESNGGDGIVAVPGCGSIRNLEGKKVAMELFSPSEFWLDMLLEERDLEKLKDEMEFVNLEGLDALDAMRRGDVTALVGREPFLSGARRELNAEILATSNETPGMVVDVLFTQADTIERRGDDLAAVVRGVYRAVRWMEDNPTASKTIIKKYLGEHYKVRADFDNTFNAVSFYGRDDNIRYFGTEDDPGAFEDTLDDVIDYWKDRGELSWNPDPEDFMNFSLITAPES
ncbi:MAG: ABC transporter substrate-binding protein [Deltaproteobacteria bacterium]|nr:ABC transporter substrate-binding protein [Candidatus Zymogenaceae bacterium]